MPRQTVASDRAPKATGPYSQAVRAGDLLFVSMQLPLDPMTGSMVRGGIRAQARRVLDNIKGILESCGGTLANVVHLNLYLKSIGDLQQVNTVMSEMLQQDLPARTTVEVSRLPKESALAMDAVAYLG